MLTPTRRVAVLAGLLVICVLAYSLRSQTFSQPATDAVTITNPAVLKDWAPENTFITTLHHIEYYLVANNIPGTLLTITSQPRYDSSGALTFEFSIAQNPSVYTVTVETANYGDGISSSSVLVNGDSTAYNAVNQVGSANFTDFGNLLTYGFSGAQVYEIQKELARFSPSSNFSVIPNSIIQSGLDSTKNTFTVEINNKKYELVSDTTGINSIHFVLRAGDGKQIFDSKTVTL